MNRSVYFHENNSVFNFDHSLSCSRSQWKVSQKKSCLKKFRKILREKNCGEVLVTTCWGHQFATLSKLLYRELFLLEKCWTFQRSKTTTTISEVKGDLCKYIQNMQIKKWVERYLSMFTLWDYPKDFTELANNYIIIIRSLWCFKMHFGFKFD